MKSGFMTINMEEEKWMNAELPTRRVVWRLLLNAHDRCFWLHIGRKPLVNAVGFCMIFLSFLHHHLFYKYYWDVAHVVWNNQSLVSYCLNGSREKKEDLERIFSSFFFWSFFGDPFFFSFSRIYSSLLTLYVYMYLHTLFS